MQALLSVFALFGLIAAKSVDWIGSTSKASGFGLHWHRETRGLSGRAGAGSLVVRTRQGDASVKVRAEMYRGASVGWEKQWERRGG